MAPPPGSPPGPGRPVRGRPAAAALRCSDSCLPFLHSRPACVADCALLSADVSAASARHRSCTGWLRSWSAVCRRELRHDSSV